MYDEAIAFLIIAFVMAFLGVIFYFIAFYNIKISSDDSYRGSTIDRQYTVLLMIFKVCGIIFIVAAVLFLLVAIFKFIFI
jgi:hypothetical protein